MAPKIDPRKLRGPWAAGYVLERQHTLRSEFLGHDSHGHPQFATERSELGELIFRLKNRNDETSLPDIADAAATLLESNGFVSTPSCRCRPRAAGPSNRSSRSRRPLASACRFRF
jgi:hypothetical protein